MPIIEATPPDGFRTLQLFDQTHDQLSTILGEIAGREGLSRNTLVDGMNTAVVKTPAVSVGDKTAVAGELELTRKVAQRFDIPFKPGVRFTVKPSLKGSGPLEFLNKHWITFRNTYTKVGS